MLESLGRFWGYWNCKSDMHQMISYTCTECVIISIIFNYMHCGIKPCAAWQALCMAKWLVAKPSSITARKIPKLSCHELPSTQPPTKGKKQKHQEHVVRNFGFLLPAPCQERVAMPLARGRPAHMQEEQTLEELDTTPYAHSW